MRIIAKRSFIFRDDNAPGLVLIRAGASNSPQDVPDWVADTATFRNAVSDGGILQLSTPAAPVVVTEVKAEPAAPAPDASAQKRRRAASQAGLVE